MANFYPPNHNTSIKTIAIDFDGVIHNADKGWHDGTCYGSPLPGSIESVRELAKKYNIVIFTAKAKSDRPMVNNKTGKELVTEWLDKHGILDCVSEITAEKPRAELYVDDNGYRFKNWNSTLTFINKIL